ncbi:TIM barrel protein [Sphingosinicella rhizophila]|uniref:TIM barrel protein n=1 Tax=Sphingosinicella rhizophila TaxID=3050082 RepID=A0ABU3Q5X9_9SPHN|nr:TIM barrel protein [Sphingosinicella sp. GR2756]MDT9598814.1 TIM barrel protein [Sphingosinicella sp. GR2756]
MLKLCASMNFLFTELPPGDRPAAAAAAGFDGIEFQDFSIEEPAVLAEAAGAAGVRIVLINVPLGDLLDGGAGLSGVPGRQRDFADALAATHEAALILKPAFINVGAFRAGAAGTQASLPLYLENIDKAAAMFRDIGAVPLIEPMNGHDIPGIFPENLDLACRLVREHCPRGAGLLLDTYHAARRGDDAAKAFASHRDVIRHIQISDFPARNEPGTGAIDFPEFFSVLRDAGYSGFVSAEYRPSASSEQSLDWMQQAVPAR